MTTLNTEEAGTTQATGTEKAKPGKRARVAQRRAHLAPKKAKSAKKAKTAKRAPKSPKKAGAARDGSKSAKVLELLKRPDGATLKELMKSTSWQSHSVRGFISTAGKKHGIKIESAKSEAGERTYKIAK